MKVFIQSSIGSLAAWKHLSTSDFCLLGILWRCLVNFVVGDHFLLWNQNFGLYSNIIKAVTLHYLLHFSLMASFSCSPATWRLYSSQDHHLHRTTQLSPLIFLLWVWPTGETTPKYRHIYHKFLSLILLMNKWHTIQYRQFFKPQQVLKSDVYSVHKQIK